MMAEAVVAHLSEMLIRLIVSSALSLLCRHLGSRAGGISRTRKGSLGSRQKELYLVYKCWGCTVLRMGVLTKLSPAKLSIGKLLEQLLCCFGSGMFVRLARNELMLPHLCSQVWWKSLVKMRRQVEDGEGSKR